MRKTTLSIAVLCLTQWAQAQVSNQVQVYVRPGTEVPSARARLPKDVLCGTWYDQFFAFGKETAALSSN